jgi:hypothetical protein
VAPLQPAQPVRAGPKKLFTLEIEMPGGSKERLTVFEGADFDALALQFCQQHSLPEKTQHKVRRLLDRNLQLFLSRASKAE